MRALLHYLYTGLMILLKIIRGYLQRFWGIFWKTRSLSTPVPPVEVDQELPLLLLPSLPDEVKLELLDEEIKSKLMSLKRLMLIRRKF